MLDAHPAPRAPARPPAAVPAPPIAQPAVPQPESRSAAEALLAAARTLLPVLEAGRTLDARTLREAMTGAFGASDADGAWLWKDAYEGAEAALVLFLQRYGRAMRREAGAGPGGPADMLRMLQTLAALEPSQTRRSEEQLEYQQFSTPLQLAYAALQAAMIRPGDVVLEPSAGTGMLAVMAQLALGNGPAGALHLNEIATVRAGLLAGLFPGSTVTRHNAESIRDRLPGLRPTVVLMNPPFSASPGIERIRHHVDLHHIRSAFSMLPPGGRLVAISSSHCVPGDTAWEDAFASLDPPAQVAFTAPIDGRAYARRGTTFDTRLTVLDRGGEKHAPVYAGHPVRDAGHLLQVVTSTVPGRRPIEPIPGADLFGQAPAPRPRRARRPRTARQETPTVEHGWGVVSELAYEAVPAGGGPAKDAQPSGPYARWRASSIHVPGAVEHPTPLVQSGAMAAVSH
ncbi:MAG: methylase, partial [Alphaproteobacteria bacterium]|nr:methylase [Alphaproteobacteria bacterium]